MEFLLFRVFIASALFVRYLLKLFQILMSTYRALNFLLKTLLEETFFPDDVINLSSAAAFELKDVSRSYSFYTSNI